MIGTMWRNRVSGIPHWVVGHMIINPIRLDTHTNTHGTWIILEHRASGPKELYVSEHELSELYNMEGNI
jgi:hypothetical protein